VLRRQVAQTGRHRPRDRSITVMGSGPKGVGRGPAQGAGGRTGWGATTHEWGSGDFSLHSEYEAHTEWWAVWRGSRTFFGSLKCLNHRKIFCLLCDQAPVSFDLSLHQLLAELNFIHLYSTLEPLPGIPFPYFSFD
jgi:hypothetical protein